MAGLDDDSEYEESLRSLDTSDEEGSESDDELSDSESDDEMGDARTWHRHHASEHRLPPALPRFPFTGNCGIHFQGNFLEMTPFDYLSLFFDQRIIDLVIEETNRYAEQIGQRDSAWRSVTEAEVWVFFGMQMLMGIVKLPQEEMNWSKDELYERPIFQKLMSLKRWRKIKQYMHFTNNESFDPDTHPNSKLYKIYEVNSLFTENIIKCYTPNQDLSIDESLMLFKGRLGWVQYIPLKRSRFGVKYFLLCEAKTGYVYRMIIYVGKGTQFDPDYDDLPVSSRVVMSLMKPLLGKGYCVTVDNYYNSPQLADILIKNKTDIYGTLRMTRKEVPQELKQAKLKKGEVVAYQRGKTMAIRWKDKKDVAMLSTIHNSSMQDVVTRQGVVKKPKVVCEYNFTMGGVDKVDQQLVDYPITRKRGKKYYKKVFFHLMDLAVWNAYIIYKKALEQSTSPGQNRPMTHLKFCHQIIRDIIAKFGCHLPQKRSPGRPSTSEGSLLQYTPGGHFPMEVPPTEKKRNPLRKCHVCSRKRDHTGKPIRKETRYMCKSCKVPLCVVPCFENYHTM